MADEETPKPDVISPAPETPKTDADKLRALALKGLATYRLTPTVSEQARHFISTFIDRLEEPYTKGAMEEAYKIREGVRRSYGSRETTEAKSIAAAQGALRTAIDTFFAPEVESKAPPAETSISTGVLLAAAGHLIDLQVQHIHNANTRDQVASDLKWRLQELVSRRAPIRVRQDQLPGLIAMAERRASDPYYRVLAGVLEHIPLLESRALQQVHERRRAVPGLKDAIKAIVSPGSVPPRAAPAPAPAAAPAEVRAETPPAPAPSAAAPAPTMDRMAMIHAAHAKIRRRQAQERETDAAEDMPDLVDELAAMQGRAPVSELFAETPRREVASGRRHVQASPPPAPAAMAIAETEPPAEEESLPAAPGEVSDAPAPVAKERAGKSSQSKKQYPDIPEGMCFTLGEARPQLRCSYELLQPVWAALSVAAKVELDAGRVDENGFVTVQPDNEDGKPVRMILGGTRRPSWQIVTDDVFGEVRRQVDAKRTYRIPGSAAGETESAAKEPAKKISQPRKRGKVRSNGSDAELERLEDAYYRASDELDALLEIPWSQHVGRAEVTSALWGDPAILRRDCLEAQIRMGGAGTAVTQKFSELTEAQQAHYNRVHGIGIA